MINDPKWALWAARIALPILGLFCVAALVLLGGWAIIFCGPMLLLAGLIELVFMACAAGLAGWRGSEPPRRALSWILWFCGTPMAVMPGVMGVCLLGALTVRIAPKGGLRACSAGVALSLVAFGIAMPALWGTDPWMLAIGMGLLLIAGIPFALVALTRASGSES
jgi:hypothetical protein